MEFESILLLFINAFFIQIISWIRKIRLSEKADDFVTLETFKIDKTRYSEVFAELVRIKDKLYVGLQRKCDFESLSDPKTKSIYLPVEAWATLQTQGAPSIEKAIKEHKVTPTARTETNKGKKRPYNNGMI